MNIKNKFKELIKNKKFGNIIILFLIGVLLIIIGTISNKSGKKATDTFGKVDENNQTINLNEEGNKSEYEKMLKDELKTSLEKIRGVGKVEVMLYFESGEEQVPAFNNTNSSSTSEENDNEGGKRVLTQKNSGQTVVVTNDGSKNEPLILKTIKPKVTGVLVVAEGAEDKVIEYKIAKAITNLFNIAENKVNVYPMDKKQK